MRMFTWMCGNIRSQTSTYEEQSECMNQSDRKTIVVVWACSKTTAGTCLPADNRHETNQKNETTRKKKMRNTYDNMGRCYEQGRESGGIGTKYGG